MRNQETKAFQGYKSTCAIAEDDLPTPRDVSGTLQFGALRIDWTAQAWPKSIIEDSISYSHAVDGNSTLEADKMLAAVIAALDAAGGWTIEDIVMNQEVRL